MSTVRVFKNILALLSERVVIPAVNLLLVIAVARYQGAEGLGQYAVIVGFVSFFDIFLDLGINTLIVRDVARDRAAADSYASKAVTLKLAVAPLIFMSIFVFQLIFPYPQDVARSFYIFSAAFVVIAFSETFNSLYKACERMNLVALMVFIRQAALAIGVVVALEFGFGITGIAWTYLAVSLVYLASNYLLFNLRVRRIRIGIDREFYKNLFENSLPFITLGFILMLMFRVDVVLISVIADDAQAGLFSAALKVVSSLLLLSAAFLEAVFPILSRYDKGSPDEMRTAVRRAFHLLAAVSFPMAAGLAAVGGDILTLLYGAEFGRAMPMFAALSLMLPIAYLSSALHYVAMARDMQRKSFMGILVLLVASFGLCAWLVSIAGGTGAALATLAFSVFAFIYLAGLVFSDLKDSSALAEVIRPLVSSCLMAGAVYYLDAGLAAKVVAGAGVYVMAMLAVKGFDTQDVSHVRDLWAHFRPSPEGDRK